MIKKNLAILGAGGHAAVVADMADLLGWSEVKFYDDNLNKRQELNFTISGGIKSLFESLDAFSAAFVAIGDNAIRLNLVRQLKERQIYLPSLVHPAAFIARSAELGDGTLVCAGAVVQVGVKLGDGCILNTSATIDHHCTICDGAHIAPGTHIAGAVSVGQRTLVGMGSCVAPAVVVGADVSIRAGSVIVKDVADGIIFK